MQAKQEMEILNKSLLSLFVFFGLVACGVKGTPLPPLEPATIGTGEPTYTNKKEEKKNTKKR